VPASPQTASGPPAVSLVVGEEELLVDRAVATLVAEAGEGPGEGGEPAPGGWGAGDAGKAHDLPASGLSPGEFLSLVSPSLFGGARAVVIRGAQDASKELAAALERYAAAPAPDTVLVLTHAGGAKGKALLTALTGRGAQVIRCAKVSRADERIDFVRGEFRKLGRKADQGSVRALIDAVGNDLSELAAACAQLASDVAGAVDQETVARYYRGRAEATGFSVADRAVEGRLGDALEQLRWALATGVSPVLISSALAQGVRALGKVGGVPRSKSSEALAGQLGMPPWKIDRVRRQLSGWTPDGVGTALRAVAEADAQVKGEGASAAYALERALRRIVACREG
jgi:DNA polymerase III subunit delta